TIDLLLGTKLVMTTHPAKQDNRKLSTATTGSGMRSLRCRSRRSRLTPKHHAWHGPLLSGRRRTYHSWAGPVWLQAHHRRYQFFLRQPAWAALVLTGSATTEQPKGPVQRVRVPPLRTTTMAFPPRSELRRVG